MMTLLYVVSEGGCCMALAGESSCTQTSYLHHSSLVEVKFKLQKIEMVVFYLILPLHVKGQGYI